MTKQFRWFDKWRHAPLQCSDCGWTGELDPNEVNIFDQLYDFTCPTCDEILAIVSFPRVDEAPGT